VPWSGAPDCPVCHRTVSGVPGPYNSKLATLGFQQAHSAIIHRTIRCATGLSYAPAEQQLFGATVDCKSADQRNSARTVRIESKRRVRGAPDSKQYMPGAAANCPVPHEDKASNSRPAPNSNGRLTWWHTGQCPVRPSPAAFPNGYNLVGGYKYHPNRPF
jgi:hypothetical protein